MEKGFGARPALGVSDQAHTAVSQLKPGDIDWPAIFEGDGVGIEPGWGRCDPAEPRPLLDILCKMNGEWATTQGTSGGEQHR